MVIWLERGADLHIAQLMPLLLTVSCFSKIQIGFTFLVLARPGSPGQRAVKRVCVCVCVCVCPTGQCYGKCTVLFCFVSSVGICPSVAGRSPVIVAEQMIKLLNHVVAPSWFLHTSAEFPQGECFPECGARYENLAIFNAEVTTGHS